MSEAYRLEVFENIKSKFPEVTESIEDYDPHLHRNRPRPTSNADTLIHFLKGCLGTGILAMPEAFMNAGIWNGFVLTALIGVLCTYELHLLVRAQYILCKRMQIPLLSYPESMKVALLSGPTLFYPFANISYYLVDIFLVIYQMGTCCVYAIFVSVNLKRLLDEQFSSPVAVGYYTLALFVPFLLILSVPTLKMLSPFSLFSNVLTFISFGIILYFILRGLPDISDRPTFGTMYTFPLFCGTTLFALESVGVVIAIENNMKTPKNFGGMYGVLNIAMFIVTWTYVGMGFFGYWKYGDDTKPSITLSLPQKDALAKVCQALYSIAIYISYGLQGFVAVDILWNSYVSPKLTNTRHPKLWEYTVRFLIVTTTVVLGLSIPMLGLFISLFGAFCLSALGIVFPSIMDICVKWPDKFGTLKWILYRDIAFILIGIYGLVAGSYSAIAEIVHNFKTGKT